MILLYRIEVFTPYGISKCKGHVMAAIVHVEKFHKNEWFKQAKWGGLRQFLRREPANVFFIDIRLDITFSRKVGFSPIDFCISNILIYQITIKPKQLIKLPKNAKMNSMFSHYNSISQVKK